MKVYYKQVDRIMDKGLQISADITPTDQKSGNSKANMVAFEKYRIITQLGQHFLYNSMEKTRHGTRPAKSVPAIIFT